MTGGAFSYEIGVVFFSNEVMYRGEKHDERARGGENEVKDSLTN